MKESAFGCLEGISRRVGKKERKDGTAMKEQKWEIIDESTQKNKSRNEEMKR